MRVVQNVIDVKDQMKFKVPLMDSLLKIKGKRRMRCSES